MGLERRAAGPSAGSSRLSGERTNLTTTGPEWLLGAVMTLNRINQPFAGEATCTNNTPIFPNTHH